MPSLQTVKLLAYGAIHAAIVLTGTMATTTWAADTGYLYDAVGNVSIAVGKAPVHTARKNDPVPSGSLIKTGDNSHAVLKFKDGQLVIMQANSIFRVRKYSYVPKQPAKSSIVFSAFEGGMRFISGLIGHRRPQSFRLATPNATIGIRGTDFLIVKINDTLYSKVISGRISMTNEAGVIEFSTGQVGLVASPKALPSVIPTTALPKEIFKQLENIPLPTISPVGSAAKPVGSASTSPAVAIVNAATTLAGVMAPAAPAPVGQLKSLAPAIAAAAALPANTAQSSAVSTTAALHVATVDAATQSALDNAPAKLNGVQKSNSEIIATPGYFLCDFCTGPTGKPDHTPPEEMDSKNGPITGDATMFGKHNLTASGANTGEICAFCHTPQGDESKVASPPLWNRTAPPLSSYRAFSTMGSASDEASASISMACLSCHDGTQAPNIVINTPSNKLNTPFGEQLYIGNDLKGHHPVGMPYAGGGQNQHAPDIMPDPVASYTRLSEFNRYTDGNKFSFYNRRGLFNRRDLAAGNDIAPFSKAGNFENPKGGFNKSTYSGTGNSTVWWIETPNSKYGRQKSDLYLFTRTDKTDSIPSESVENKPYVECATCHDPHSTNPTFLRIPGGNVRSQVCLTCHDK